MTADLKKYREKRDFNKTPEPQGVEKEKASKSLIFVIQKHRASHLHFDLRLERGRVLKSWAVPKTPPSQAGIKRLAVETEDHPLGYEDFEGTIPEGNYGAGTVETWDRGSYTPIEWKENTIVFEVKAKKLKGVFCLVKLKPKEARDKNWLFFKKKPETTKATKEK
jgi:DNA ligase D-like protein (predicted 3'-phosphoesterase)